MRIIEKNNRVECECGCIYEYEKDDIDTSVESELVSILTWQRDYYRHNFVCCPVCGKRKYLYKEWYKRE